jgi:hypothetical protein
VYAVEFLRASEAANHDAMTVHRHARQQAFEMHGHVFGTADRDHERRVGGQRRPLHVLGEAEQIGGLRRPQQ